MVGATTRQDGPPRANASPASRANRLACSLFLTLTVASSTGLSNAQEAQAPTPLVLERTIPLPRVLGRIDHLAADVQRQRVFVAELGNGSVDAVEITDLDPHDELRVAETQLAELLAAEDIDHLGAAMEPGTTAGVLVWENRWAAPFASAARRAGGQLIASGRIPIQAIAASMDAEE